MAGWCGGGGGGMGMQKSVGEASVDMMMMMKKKRREAKGERVEFETVQTLYTSSEGARGWSDGVDEANAGRRGGGGEGQARGRRGRETTRPSNNKHRTTTRIT